MGDADIFDKAMASRGGRFDRNWISSPSDDDGYISITRWADTLIASARDHVPTLPEIHFDFIYNAEPQALAFKSNGRYFIGMTTGLRYLIELIFFRMLSDSHLFESIGDPKAESQNVPALTGYKAHAEAMYDLHEHPTSPLSPPRHSFSCHLIHHAAMFLIGHETAHISLGHVDYMESIHGDGFITEAGWSDTEAGGLIERQALEWQADNRSVASAIHSLQLEDASSDLQTPSLSIAKEAPGVRIFNWAFAVNSLFRLLDGKRFDPLTLSNRSYPPNGLRRAMLTISAYAYTVEAWDSQLKDVALKALHMAARYTEESFSVILGNNDTLGGMPDAYAPESQAHSRAIATYWKEELRNRVGPFAYESGWKIDQEAFS